MVTKVFVCELSTLLCLYYHVIYIQVTGLDYLTFFGVERLSWCLYVSYRLCFAYIAMIFAQKLPGVLFSTTFILGLKELP